MRVLSENGVVGAAAFVVFITCFVNPGTGDGMENSRSILAEDFFYCLSLHTRTHY